MELLNSTGLHFSPKKIDMHVLHNLSIKVKLGIIILPLVLALSYFTAIVINRNYQTSNDLERLENAISLSISISNMVHELQRERGTTAGYLTSQGKNFGPEQIIRREATNKKLEEFSREVELIRSSDFAEEAEPLIERQLAAFGEISNIREKVDLLSITANQEIDLISNINDRSIKIIRDLVQNIEDKEFFQQVTSYTNYLFIKERAGIERALMTSIYTLGRFDSQDDYRTFSILVAEQDNLLENFIANASDEWVDKLKEIIERDKFDTNAFNKVEEIRANTFANETFNTDPSVWFNIMTTKIDLLKEVENFLTKRIVEGSIDASQQARNNFYYLIGISFILGIIVFVLLISVVGKILRNVRQLELFSHKVSKGNLSENISIQAKDEIGQFAGVFSSMVESIKTTQEELEREKNNAQFLYENTYKQSEVVFENVNQGIFLMDVKFNMSKLYSKEMENIFKNDKIAGENFIQFMRPRLIARDQDALEMFVKHLFNADIEEDVVNKLNPIEHVQIFSSNEQGELNSKYIKVSFSRVKDNGGVIHNILVTVIDETETVLLQKEIEESEGKNKQEMELMLSILKIDPIVLGEFLTTCKQSLGGISQRYETDSDKNFKELISFTYNTIHNLKANASLIELQALADSFHEIEELLSKLQGKKLIGDDFLKILYEINVVNDIIDNMHDLLARILSVSYKNTDKNELDSSEKLVSTLREGAAKISQEMNKRVEFQFENDGGFSIPERYKTDIKDILLQLIRNSVVHGIELPEDRIQKKKLENGLIKVTISEVNDRLSLHYFDDGQGLDLNKIMQKALTEKLISAEQITSFSTKDIGRLLFKDGFTTAHEVNQHAGRGQGMSLIGRIIKKLDGDIKMNFKKGESFEMQFSFPMVETSTEIKSVA